MHWPIGFQPRGAPVPKDENGKAILDKEVTTAEVASLQLVPFLINLDLGSNGKTCRNRKS